MGKIPVGRVVGQTYRFVFGGYFTILSVVWLPLLVMMAVGYFLFLPMMHDFPGIIRDLTQHLGDPAMLAMLKGRFSGIYGFDFLALLFSIWIQVGITKEILGLRNGPRFVYLPTGADEGRVLLTYIVLFILVYLVIIAVAIVAAVVGAVGYAIFTSGAAKNLDPPTVGIFLMPALLIGLAILYVFVRLFYFVGPATVAERHMILNRSWQLTRGNFWRIFVILLATILPIYLMQAALMGAIAFPVIHQIVTTQTNADPAAVFAALWGTMAGLLPYGVAAGLVIAPIFNGLLIAPPAFAYRALLLAKPA